MYFYVFTIIIRNMSIIYNNNKKQPTENDKTPNSCFESNIFIIFNL